MRAVLAVSQHRHTIWGLTMLESVATFITAIKNGGPPIYAATFIATALLLFLPDVAIVQMASARHGIPIEHTMDWRSFYLQALP